MKPSFQKGASTVADEDEEEEEDIDFDDDFEGMKLPLENSLFRTLDIVCQCSLYYKNLLP